MLRVYFPMVIWRKRFICINLKVFRFSERNIRYPERLRIFIVSNRHQELGAPKLINISKRSFSDFNLDIKSEDGDIVLGSTGDI